LKKATLILLFGRKVERKSGIGFFEPAMDIPMSYGFVTPFIYIYIGFIEEGVL
jgi:hypothetical protein